MICNYEDCMTSEEHCPFVGMEERNDCPCLKEVINRLKSYEDAEENGLLLKLSCKIGDTVYFLNEHGTYTEARIKQIALSNFLSYECCYFSEPKEKKDYSYRYGDEDFGKLIFLTKKEAEAKLTELRGAENG